MSVARNLLLYVSIVFIISIVTSINTYFQRIEDDVTADILESHTPIGSLLRCASICGHDSNCKSMKYINNNKTCVLLANLLHEVEFTTSSAFTLDVSTYMVGL